MNPLIKKYGKESRWVIWKLQERNGKKTKIPYSIFGDMASSTDSATWSTYKEAKDFGKNIGIVFTPEQKLLGIDIDHCLNKETKKIEHEQRDAIKRFIQETNTYTEISPSGEGLHLFLEVPEGLNLKSNRHTPFETYTSGRYFTFTAEVYRDSKEIRSVSNIEAERLLGIIGYPWKKEEVNVNKPIDFVNKQEPVVNKQSAVVNTVVNLDDSQIIEKMFSAKNGEKIKDIYYKSKGNSEDDLSLCSHLAFWCRKDFSQIERIWLSSPLGQRSKTLKRQDYRTRTINTAIASCKEVYEIPTTVKMSRVDEKYELDLLFTITKGEGKIFTQNTENICRILRKHPDFQGRLKYDKFRNTFEIFSKNIWRVFEDNDAVDIQTLISIAFPYFGRVGKEMVYDAMVKVAKENTVDSALDYINSLHWDGVARLDEWLNKTYGAPIDAYHKAVGANWIKGLVKRIIEPGCKFDYVLVLEGPQGSKKSTSLSVLAKGWYVETTMSTDTKDFFMQFAGNLIIEFSEGETLNRTEVKKMKAIITTQVDKYRPSYGRSVLEFPRRCVFAMTTNDEEYLKDDTGNRRWLPVKLEIPEANVEWLEINRDQLLSEAHHRLVVLRETVYEFPKEEMQEIQNARRVHYEHESEIVWWFHNKLTDDQRSQGITVHQVYRDALNGGFNSKMLNKSDEMKISIVLRDILKLNKKRVMINNHRVICWVDDTLKPSEVVYKNTEDDY